MVNFTTVVCRISSRLKGYKTYKNRLRLAKVIVKNILPRFFLVHCVYELAILKITFPSSRQPRSNDDCLEDNREDYHNCSVLYFVRQLCTVIRAHIRAVLKVDCWFSFRLSLDLGLLRCVFMSFCSGVVCFCCVGSSALSQETGWKERLPNDLICVK